MIMMMMTIVHNLVDVGRNALVTFNATSVARNSFLKLYQCIELPIRRDYRACTYISAFKHSLVAYNLSAFLYVFK